MKVAVAFSTCDRVELSLQSIQPLLNGDFHTYIFDGSKTPQGKGFPDQYEKDVHKIIRDVRGGSGAAIVCALTTLLASKENYTHISLVENDVVLDPDWFEPTMALFERGAEDGLDVGSASSRCYLDRILIQRDDYAVLHNTGAGMIVFTRKAAELVLREYRTQWTSENRAIFSQLTGKDIGAYWAFKGTEHWLVADWRWDALLASHGMASLGLTPSKVKMIGQIPALEEQGLTLSTEPLDALRSDDMFVRYQENLRAVHGGHLKIASSGLFHRDISGARTIFPHQLASIGGHYEGNWRLKDAMGFGPFAWISQTEVEDRPTPNIYVPILGPCELMMSGGANGSEAHVVDEQSGYDARPVLQPEGKDGRVMSIQIPGHMNYRTIRVTFTVPGAIFYGVRCREEQPLVTAAKFDYSVLPKP